MSDKGGRDGRQTGGYNEGVRRELSQQRGSIIIVAGCVAAVRGEEGEGKGSGGGGINLWIM